MKLPLIALLLSISVASLAQYPRQISFSGHLWRVKTSSGKVGPGPNYFSDSANSVFVDSQDRLHLKIQKVGNKWQCSEVVSEESFGYGTYRFYLDSPVNALDPTVVLGLFTWNDAPDYNHRELDIEFSRWGSVNNLNAQYVVQPYNVTGNIIRWNEPANVSQSTHSFHWSSSSVDFLSAAGLTAAPTAGEIIQQWSYANAAGIPAPGGENARINLWLYNGRAPKGAVEIIVNRFEFTPAP
jgi:hypothetical protein